MLFFTKHKIKTKKNKTKKKYNFGKLKNIIKVKTGSSYNPINFIQHNIGQVEYNIKKKLTDLSKFKGPIKNKRYSKNPKRDFNNYFKNDNIINKEADIFFLQEVQYGEENFTSKNYKYYINYIVTGHIDYCDEKEQQNKIKKIYHGCMIGFNQFRFKIIEGIYSMNIFKRGVRLRTTDILIIKDIITNKKYSILSLHGPIINSPINIDKIDMIEKFYFNITDAIEEINKKYKNMNYLICGDFNINLLNPNFNPFDEKRTKIEKELLKNYYNILEEFKIRLNYFDIYIYEIDKKTAYGKDFKETLDFIILSKNLYKKLNLNLKTYFTGNKIIELGDLEFLKNDFDHTKLLGSFY